MQIEVLYLCGSALAVDKKHQQLPIRLTGSLVEVTAEDCALLHIMFQVTPSFGAPAAPPAFWWCHSNSFAAAGCAAVGPLFVGTLLVF
jgi:hypothetical protein